MKLLMAASEFSPLARTGGLGEAVAGIANAMARLGHDVTVAMPAYRHLRELGTPETAVGPEARLLRHRVGEVTVLLVDDPPGFDRPGIYGDRPGEGYDDQWWRFGRFSATVRLLANEFDLLHLHDAHVGPAALGASIPTVMTVHNASYSILGPLAEAGSVSAVGFEALSPVGAMEWYGRANYMKAGIVGADRVTTVSPSFAEQLTTDDSVSGGLTGVFGSLDHGLVGIVNGIDETAWNPLTDSVLTAGYSASKLKPRQRNRAALLDMAGLEDGIIFGNVGRMSEQKGLALLDPHLDDLVASGFRLVLVGSGELDPMVDDWVTRFPHAVWHQEYREELNRTVAAGADAYLMPSRFEPCGIGQLYAMRYGAVPVVRFTGGLADTVTDLDETNQGATGFGFRLFESVELAKTVRRAMRIFTTDPKTWRELQHNGMEADFSWDRAASQYGEVYEAAAADRSP